MGGRAAEELLFHEVTGGASNDFEKANQIATTMVTQWGMGRDPEAKDARHRPAAARSRSSSPTPNGSLPSEVQAAGDARDPRRSSTRPTPRRCADAHRPHRHAAPDRRLPRRARAGRRRRRSTRCSTAASRSPRPRRVAPGDGSAARLGRHPALPRAPGPRAGRRARAVGRARRADAGPGRRTSPAAIALDGLPGGRARRGARVPPARPRWPQPSEPLAEVDRDVVRRADRGWRVGVDAVASVRPRP